MYRIYKSIDVDFAHHIRGHRGHCINIHGHTWKFEVGLHAKELDAEGFVVDFSKLKREILKPCHALLDHSLAIGEATWNDVGHSLEPIGVQLLKSRIPMHQTADTCERIVTRLGGAENRYPGGMKVTVFPFSPTSERIAEWLFNAAVDKLQDDRVKVSFAQVYETLHPVEAVAEYRPE